MSTFLWDEPNSSKFMKSSTSGSIKIVCKNLGRPTRFIRLVQTDRKSDDRLRDKRRSPVDFLKVLYFFSWLVINAISKTPRDFVARSVAARPHALKLTSFTFKNLWLRANGRNNSQHCCRNNVGSCCVLVGSSVQTDATTPNNVGTCSASWEGYNP